MIDRESNQLYVQFGDDVTDVQRWLERTPARWSIIDSVRADATERWDLRTGWSGALALARDGWSAGALDLHVAAELLPVHDFERGHSYDVAGEFPDVSRYVAGEPLHMHVRKRRPKAPVVHLVVNVVTSGATNAEAFRNYGAAMVNLIDRMENAGRRVELDVVAVNGGLPGIKRSIVGWKVKRAEDALDLGAVAFAIGHPAAFRRLMFAMWERTYRTAQTHGYGRCAKLEKRDLVALDCPNALAIQGIGENWKLKPADALALAIKQINEAAGETLVEGD